MDPNVGPSAEGPARGMALADLLDDDLIRIGLHAGDREEAIRQLADLLLAKGFVTPEFPAAVLEREAEFPTGLPTEGMPIALPHTEARHVCKSCMAVGILEDPVPFRVMGSPDEEIAVHGIFLLAIANHDSQVLALQQLADLFQDGSTLARLATVQDERQALTALSEGIRRLQGVR